MRSLIDVGDLSVAELDALFLLADSIAGDPAAYAEVLRGKKLATLFFEPSTRTRLSFEAAMLELGGSVIGFSDAGSSSATKGESVADTARIVGLYADIIAMRHPKEGAALLAAEHARRPVINAGDGGHAHPTQTLADLYTLRRRHGGCSGLTVGVCGDLKYGRTVHSLLLALSRYEGVRVLAISPKELALPPYLVEELGASGMELTATEDLTAAIPSLDVLYMTRIQRERFEDPAEYERLKDSYVLGKEQLAAAKPTLSVLHPLPRVNEIRTEVDDDPRAAYFEQAENGKYMRMALLLTLLRAAERDPTPMPRRGTAVPGRTCRNRSCITNCEDRAPRFFGEDGACVYCDR